MFQSSRLPLEGLRASTRKFHPFQLPVLRAARGALWKQEDLSHGESIAA